jgi:hypothetical protein
VTGVSAKLHRKINNAIKQSQFKWLRSRCTQYKTQSFNITLNSNSKIKLRVLLEINCAFRKGAEEVFLDSQRWVQAPLVKASSIIQVT